MTKKETERLGIVETKVDRAVQDIKELKTTIEDEFKGLSAKIDNLDKKYAPKWVQQIVGGFVVLVLIAFATAVIALVIIPASKKNADGSTDQTTTPTTSNPQSVSPNTPATANASAEAQADGTKATDSEGSGGLLNKLPLIKVGD